MLALETAIQTKYRATPAVVAALGGTLWAGRAPEGAAMPYAVLTVIAAPLTVTFNSSLSQPVVQFAAFGMDRDAVGQAFAQLVQAFDAGLLPMTAGKMFDVLRLDEPLPMLMPDEDDRGSDVWRWSCRYRFAVRNP